MQITQIELNKLVPHPSNPRKDLGELSELTASIQERGILQPLTVVAKWAGKRSDEYRVICGHRRMAAAIAAGLKTIPCVVSDMTEHDQITAMLTENIQRSNLTPLEEADGFQMMLDLGDGFPDIAKSTGVSESTVRRRVKLLELDRDKVEKTLDKGGTLEQYSEVLAIKNEDERNKVLDTVGTDSYNFTIKRVKEQEKSRDESAEFLAQVAQKYIFRERDDLEGLILVKSVSIWDKNLPADDSGAKYYAKQQYGVGYNIFRERNAADNATKEREDKRRAAESAIKREHDELKGTAYLTRRSFIQDLSEQALTKKSDVLSREMVDMFLHTPRWGLSFDHNAFAEAFGLDVEDYEDESDEYFYNELLDQTADKPHKAQAAMIYALSDDRESRGYIGNNLAHNDNAELDRLYNFLNAVGYAMSDTEKELQSGKHKLFAEAAALTGQKG